MTPPLAIECPRGVSLKVQRLTGFVLGIVAKFHDVIEIAGLVVTTDVQNVDEAVVIAGDRLEFQNAPILAVVGSIRLKVAAENHLDGPVGAGHRAGQPNLAVRTTADLANQLVACLSQEFSSSRSSLQKIRRYGKG